MTVEVKNRPNELTFNSPSIYLGDIPPESNKMVTFLFDVNNVEVDSSGKIELLVQDGDGQTWKKEINIKVISSIPEESKIWQNYPNPFSSQGTWIPYRLSSDTKRVTLDIYNILGQKVKTIEVGPRKAASYTKKDRAIFWDLKNDSGQNILKGLYYIKIKLRASNFSATKAMVIE